MAEMVKDDAMSEVGARLSAETKRIDAEVVQGLCEESEVAFRGARAKLLVCPAVNAHCILLGLATQAKSVTRSVRHGSAQEIVSQRVALFQPVRSRLRGGLGP